MIHPLNTQGLLCPMPVIKLQSLANTLAKGSQIELRATDPGTQYDIPTWCKIHGHKVINQQQEDDLFIFLIALQ